MVPRSSAIEDAVKLSTNASAMLDHVAALERHTREMIMTGGKKERIASMNEKINGFLRDARDMIVSSKIAIEYAQEELKKEDPNHPDLHLFEKKLAQLDKMTSRLNHMQERVLSRIATPKADPLFESLKSTPKPSNIDPEMNAKITNVIAEAFDDLGLVKKNSIAKLFNGLNKHEKNLFLDELAKKILHQDHARLNALEVLSQLSKPDLLRVRESFIKYLNKENQDIEQKETKKALENLESINVPNVDPPKPPAPEPAPKSAKQEQFEQQVKEAVEGGFAKFKEILSTIPKSQTEERYQLIVAVREESERRKAEKPFEQVKVPKEEPTPKNRC